MNSPICWDSHQVIQKNAPKLTRLHCSLALVLLLNFGALCLNSTWAHAEPSANNSIDNIRIWQSPSRTRLVLDLKQTPAYDFFTLSEPNRTVIDLQVSNAENALPKLTASIEQLELQQSAIQSIRTSQKQKKQLRIVFDLEPGVTSKHFKLSPNQRYGNRLVIDFYNENRALPQSPDPILELMQRLNAAPQSAPLTKPTPAIPKSIKRSVVIAIDAGHGGEDPGAIGHSGAREKDIVLKVAKQLATEINQTRGMRAVLIRTSDYYVSLNKRRERAKSIYEADLFISLHADAWHKKKARGASVFILSNTGASSTRARYLAKKENAADEIGGVFTDAHNPMLKQVLVDLALNGSMEHSVTAGQFVLNELGKVVTLHKPKVEKAGFAVLKTAQMPALLVELGFMTNPAEERLLKKNSHQKKLAKAIRLGLTHYFKDKPPPNTYFAYQKNTSAYQP